MSLHTIKCLIRIDSCIGIDCETMKDSLEETVDASRPIQVAYDELEQRTTALLTRYNEYVCSASSHTRLHGTDAFTAGQYIIRNLHLVERHRLICRGDSRATREGTVQSHSSRYIVDGEDKQYCTFRNRAIWRRMRDDVTEMRLIQATIPDCLTIPHYPPRRHVRLSILSRVRSPSRRNTFRMPPKPSAMVP